MYRLAAEQGDAEAQYRLALMYEQGEGVPENNKQAVKWYRLAAEQGYVEAQYELGVRYMDGNDGVIQDYVYAHMWYNLAASNGAEYAEKSRYEAAKEMTPADISEATRLAREFEENERGARYAELNNKS